MYADGALGLYTTIAGWKYYGIIWDLLLGTGIVFLPILFIVMGQVLSARQRSSMMGASSDALLSGLEGTFLKLFLVIALCATPISFLNVSATAVKPMPTAGAAIQAATDSPVVAVCNTQSEWDTAMEETTPWTTGSVCTDSVGVPLWWYLTMAVSTTLTKTIVEEMTAANSMSYRALHRAITSVNITDGETRYLFGRFQSSCEERARRLFNREKAVGPVQLPGAEFDAGSETDWAGSALFIERYYPLMYYSELVPGVPWDANAAPEYSQPQPNGRPTCLQAWTIISDRIAAEASLGDKADYNSWFNYLGSFFGWSAEDTRSRMIKAYLLGSNIPMSRTTEQIARMQNIDSDLFGKAVDTVADIYSTVEMAKLVITTSFIVDALLLSLPILQAYILMIIYVGLPFGLVLSGYDIGFLIKAAVLIFVVTFWSAIWALCAWIDETFAAAIFGNGDNLIEAVFSLDEHGTRKRLAHNIVVGSIYILAPTIFSWVFLMAGFGEAANLSNRAVSGGAMTSIGTGATNRVLGAASRGRRLLSAKGGKK